MPLIIMSLIGMLIIFTALINISQLTINLIELLMVYFLSSVFLFALAYCQVYEMFTNIGITIFIAVYLYIKTHNITRSLLLSTITMIIAMAADSITAPINLYLLNLDPNNSIVQIRDSGSFYIVNSIFVLFFTFLLSYFIGRFLKDKLNILNIDLKSELSRYLIGGALITLSLFYANIFLVDSFEPTLMIIVTSLLSVGYMVFLIAAVYAFVNNMQKTVEITHKQELLDNLQNYTSNIENLYTEMRRFRHDYVNILASIYGYAENNDNEGLQRYLLEHIMPGNERITRSNEDLDRLAHIKPPEIKGLLALKLSCAQQSGIDVHIEVSEPIENINMHMVDLCRVSGILLDNAIEACGGEEAVLNFTALRDGGDAVFIFANTTTTPPDMAKMFQKGYTTKREGRGLGLYSLQTTIGKYQNISLSTQYEKGELVFRMCISD